MSKLNADIPGRNIMALSSGEYSRRRVAESITYGVLLTPLALFALFSKKKRDQFGIEYKTTKGNKAALIQVKKLYGMGLATDLQAVSGKKIIGETAKK